TEAPVPWHTTEIACSPPPGLSDRPLVLDLSALWAGPLAAHLLGAAGSTVVKVETAEQQDGARLGDRRFFDLLHGGHDSVVIDAAAPRDRRLLRRLAERADIVVASARPRAFATLGLDPAACCRQSPTTWVS